MNDSSENGAPRPGRRPPPALNPVGLNDLLEVLAQGLLDFKRAPAYGLLFSGLYVVGGWAMILFVLTLDLPYLVYPLAAGFALIAPFIASGFYVVSRHLEQTPNPEQGDLNWSLVLKTIRSMVQRDLGWMALITGFSFFIWLDIAAILTFGFMGFQFFGFQELINDILTTPAGWLFLIIGNAVGAVIAFTVFSVTVLSIPMLFDRDIDFVTAMVTSVRFVAANLRVMAVWCAAIAAMTGISLLSGLIGLFVTMPILGHATWHLYRRAVPPRSA